MRSEELLEIVLARPFKPHRFTFTTGESYDLTHPEMMIVGRSLVTFGIPSEENVRIADRQFHMSLLHIVKVEPIGQGSKSANGKRKQK
jgi:hypothetical protein